MGESMIVYSEQMVGKSYYSVCVYITIATIH